jgi:hypothetical protein
MNPRLVRDGAIVLLVGLLSGLPTTVESIGGGSERTWHVAHEALIMMGVWIIAAAAVRPALVLNDRELLAYDWSHRLMGYAFAVALVLGGAVDITPFAPGPTPVAMAAFVMAVGGILGAFVAAVLIILGAHRAAAAR